jgi:hypothetical protein
MKKLMIVDSNGTIAVEVFFDPTDPAVVIATPNQAVTLPRMILIVDAKEPKLSEITTRRPETN